MADYILAIDQGTTSTRSVCFDREGGVIASSQQDLTQHYPKQGWVEHDAEEIWTAVLATMRDCVAKLEGKLPTAIGITNQRETTVVWERASGKPVHRAIVWQDRRTANLCRSLREAGHGDLVQSRTGLVLDPYFSATKISFILDEGDGLRARAEAGELAFGTIESFLVWRLTGGLHVSDATNAARTMLLDIHKGHWDDDLLDLFNVPRGLLPDVVANMGPYGSLDPGILGAPVPICGMAGDQQAAAIGQACVKPGAVKSTYGTGCFVLQNTGRDALHSDHKLLSTIAYDLGEGIHYALEGSIFVAGAVIQWVRDGLGLIENAEESARLAMSIDSTGGVYFVPALTGLGAPHWDADARGLICGLTRGTGRAEIVRAALESVAYQTVDLIDAFEKDGAGTASVIRVDGGMVANDWFLQFLADVLGKPVERPRVIESTVQGAAFLATLGCGWFTSLEDVANQWSLDRRFDPTMPPTRRTDLLNGWQTAVSRTLSNSN